MGRRRRHFGFRSGVSRELGFILVILGSVIVLFSIPGWLWLFVLGLIFVGIGIWIIRCAR